jgi:outer membrane protein TolC
MPQSPSSCRIAVAGVVALVALAGCAEPRVVIDAGGKPVRPRSISVASGDERRSVLSDDPAQPADHAPQPGSLAAWVRAAAAGHPTLNRLRAELLADEMRVEAVAGLDNPTLRLRAEKLPVGRGYSLDDADFSAEVRQPLPVSGGPAARATARRAQTAVRTATAHAAARRLERELCIAFAQAVAARDALAARQEIHAHLSAAARIVDTAQAEGGATLLDVDRARDAAAEARIAAAEAERHAARVMAGLRRAVGDAEAALPPNAQLPDPAIPAGLGSAELRLRARTHPAVLAAGELAAVHGAARQIASAEALDEFALTLGYEYEGRLDAHWLIIGLDLPLPLFSQTGAAERVAEAEGVAALQAQAEIVVGVLSRLRQLRADLAAIDVTLAQLTDQLQPAALRRVRALEQTPQESRLQLLQLRAESAVIAARIAVARGERAAVIFEIRDLANEPSIVGP